MLRYEADLALFSVSSISMSMEICNQHNHNNLLSREILVVSARIHGNCTYETMYKAALIENYAIKTW
jgi:hypothetical protein